MITNRRLSIIALCILVHTTMYAKLFNTDPLISRGVDPHVINLIVTPFNQDVGYKMVTDADESIDDVHIKHTFNLLYDPFKSYGIDIRLQIPKEQVSQYDESDMKEDLDRLMGVQSYLQSERLYDQNSLKYLGKRDGYDVIYFQFKEDAIPRELKFYKSFEGTVYIKDGVLKKIEAVNTKPFYLEGVDVEKYKKVIYFEKPTANEGYLVSKSDVSIKGTKKGAPYTSLLHGEVSYYWDESQAIITLENGSNTTKSVDDKAYKTIFVELDRTLPLLGQDARKEGYDLPKAFGVSLITMMQQTRFYMTSFVVDDHDISSSFDENSRYENVTMVSMLQFDTWILPFLNVSLFLGGTDTATDLTLDTNPICTVVGCVGGGEKSFDPFITNSLLYGVGATLGGGVGNYFTTINFQYMTAYTKSADVQTEVTVITPLVGYYFQDYGVRVMVGGMYEDLKEYLDFDLAEAGAPNLKGRVGLRADKWAGTFGVNYDFTRHFVGNLVFAYGKDFQNASVVTTYRW